MILRHLSHNIGMYSLIVLAAWQMGCSGTSILKANVKGPYKHDDLTNGSSIGMVTGGTFTADGWKPGSDGSISYDLPGVAQGTVEVVATGLNRSDSESVFITLYEPGNWKYADPYILLNPYLVTVAMNNFTQTPQSPFRFLWTMKAFPSGTAPLDRYVEGLPLGGGGYENSLSTQYAPVFPDSKNSVKIQWGYGKAGLYFNGKLLAEHDYRPGVFNPQALKLVVGKTPGVTAFGLEQLEVKTVTVSLPGV